MGGMNTSASSSQSWSQSLSDYFSNSFSNQNSTSQSVSQSATKESDISKTQAEILKNRESQYNNTYFPELVKAINEQTPGTAEFNAIQEQQANAINTSYDAAQKATNQAIAQQGISGTTAGSGTQAALTAANERARSSALAQSYFNTLSQQTANKQKLLSLMGSSMTTPTTDTGYLSESNSTSTSQSTSNSESTSGGESKSESGAESNSKSFGFQVG